MKKISISMLVIFILTNIFILNQSSSLAAGIETECSEQNEISIIELDLTTQEVKTIKNIITNFSATELDTKEPYSPSYTFTPRVIIGDDDRKPVSNTKVLPYSAIGKLEIKYTNDYPTLHGATAFLISKNVALTAGHCIYQKDLGYAKSMKFYPGMSGTIEFPFGYDTVRSCQVPEEWTQNQDSNYDWGIIILNSNIGNQAGYLGVNRFTNLDDFKNLRVEISGYPANEYIQYYQIGNISSATDTTLNYQLDVTGGQSGSPIIDKNNGRVVGIVNREHNYLKWNYGARINTRLLSAAQQAVTNNA